MDSASTNRLNTREQRYFPRWHLNNKVIYTLKNDPTTNTAVTKDFSSVGACIVTDKNLPVSQKLNLTMELTPQTNVDLCATIIWQKAFNSSYLVGLSFYETSSQAQELLLKHALSLSPSEVIEHWYYGWNSQSSQNPPNLNPPPEN